MLYAAIYVLALLAPATQPPAAQSSGGQNPAFRGTGETHRRYPSSGLTLEKLNGLPRFRQPWYPPQPQVWLYQPNWGYAAYPSLGGYMPPRGGGYSPRITLWWGW